MHASHIVLACQDVKKGEAAVEAIGEEVASKSSTKLEVWHLDLASYESVRTFGQRIRNDLRRLDGFVANAAMEVQRFQVAEGIEKHFAVNVVSNLMSAISVLPALCRTAKEYGIQTTLTFCGSMYHIFGSDAEFDAGLPKDTDMFHQLSIASNTDIIWRYALSKLMVHQCYHELVKQFDRNAELADSGVILNIINPGWCGTELSRHKPSNAGEKIWFTLIGWTAEKGSRAYIHALAAGKVSHGRYLSGCQYKSESEYVRSERGHQIQERMWRDLMRNCDRAYRTEFSSACIVGRRGAARDSY